jgi:hypothetical protein
MKALLLDRFAFSPSNVHTLYNADATRKNILASLKTLLDQCKPGDALFFFFSGHGVWINNRETLNDSVKKGMNQAVVTSDLYTENAGCLLKDAMLKKSFNRFIDKNVTVTTVFDCCYSGNMMMQMQVLGENMYERPRPRDTTKFMTINMIGYTPKIDTPAGCRLDTSGVVIDTLDMDQDGVPDCKDYELNTPQACFPVTEDGIGACTAEAIASFTGEEDITSDIPSAKLKGPDSATRAFNLSAVINISDRERVARPSERLNSGFLSVSATSDTEKGLEIRDESGIKHGAFTKALLSVYKSNPASLPVADLMKKISAQMNQQQYKQRPTYHYDKGRLNGNLIGTESTAFKKSITATCSDIRAGIITLNKGFDAGIEKGNVLTTTRGTGKIRIQVIESDAMNAFATPIDIGIVGIKKGDEFTLTDAHVISAPLVKLYIAGSKLTAESFNTLFTKKVKPLVNLENYRDYNLWTNEVSSQNIFFNESKPVNEKIAAPILDGANKDLFYVFLPIPGFIADACKQSLQKDQNVELVNTIDQADYVLYLNYAKPRQERPGEYVFTFCRPIRNDVNTYGERTFSIYKVKVPNMNIKGQQLTQFSKDINESARLVIRGRTTRWLNEYKRK